ncbi:hypothetical protein [Priestia aryabhattai]
MLQRKTDEERVEEVLKNREVLEINFKTEFGDDFDNLSLQEQKLRIKVWLNKSK